MKSILIVEDNAIDLEITQRLLAKAFPNVVVRVACDPYQARESIAQDKPDLILLDQQLPRMSGAEFLSHLKRSYPLPVIAMTGDVADDKDLVDRLDKLGALTLVEKPCFPFQYDRFANQLCSAISDAIDVQPARHSNPNQSSSRICVIGIGSSTGGPKALEQVLRDLKPNSPPIVIAQHISDHFSDSLVDNLNRCTAIKVQKPHDQQRLKRGNAYVVPPIGHVEVTPSMTIRLVERNESDSFAPSINILFHSLAKIRMGRPMAVLLTGMGNDGAEGMLAVRKAGGLTIAQDASTSIVYGMPARAAECGAATQILPLGEIPPEINQQCKVKNRSFKASESTKIRVAMQIQQGEMT